MTKEKQDESLRLTATILSGEATKIEDMEVETESLIRYLGLYQIHTDIVKAIKRISEVLALKE